MGKGERERAEVSRSRAATSHLSCRRGRSWRAGGRWWQSHPVCPPPPPFSSVGMLFCPHCYTYRRPLPRFLSPFTHRLHFFHNEHFRHLTDALTRSDGISFTSSTAENYEQKGQGLQCRQHIMVYPVTTE